MKKKESKKLLKQQRSKIIELKEESKKLTKVLKRLMLFFSIPSIIKQFRSSLKHWQSAFSSYWVKDKNKQTNINY